MLSKVCTGIALVALIGLLALIAYQINRTTWSEVDRKCHGLFTRELEEAPCRLTYYTQQYMDEQR